MASQQSKAKAFGKLHVAGKPLVLYNVWDPGSAKAVTSVGAKAVGIRRPMLWGLGAFGQAGEG